MLTLLHWLCGLVLGCLLFYGLSVLLALAWIGWLLIRSAQEP